MRDKASKGIIGDLPKATAGELIDDVVGMHIAQDDIVNEGNYQEGGRYAYERYAWW